jgi:hypothetical protein
LFEVGSLEERFPDPGSSQATRQLTDEEARYIGFDEIPTDEVGDLPVDPDSHQRIVGRIGAPGIAALTLVRRLRPPVHESDSRLFFLDSSLTFDQGVHGTFERKQIAQPFDIASTGVDRALVEETVVLDLRQQRDCGLFESLVPSDEREEIVSLNVTLRVTSGRPDTGSGDKFHT